jgi:hypothetical protein
MWRHGSFGATIASEQLGHIVAGVDVKDRWATLSIYDHRADYFLPSLLLFDRVVMPVPTTPVGDLTLQELDQLSADAQFLSDSGCAVSYDWDPGRFDAFMADALAPIAASALGAKVRAATAAHDAPLNTRYQSEYYVEQGIITIPEVDVSDVIAMPIFASREVYRSFGDFPEYFEPDADQQVTVDLILNEFPVPAPDTPLEKIVNLREQGFVREQVGKLREWEVLLLEDLHKLGDDAVGWKLRLDRAELQLHNAVADYRRAMANHIETQRSAWVSTLLSVLKRDPIGAAGRLYTEHRDVFTLRSQQERSWKSLGVESYAFAGVICAATENTS